MLTRATGDWGGKLERAGTSADFKLHLISSNGQLSGTFDWPDLGYVNVPLLGVRFVDGNVRLSVPLPFGSLRLIGKPQGKVFVGQLQEITHRAKEWVTLPPEGNFSLHRVRVVKPPYTIESTSFVSGDIRLAGQIFVPKGSGRHPAVVFIHGSGDSDRSDGAYFADCFARRGILALTYDKRGVGQSQGNWRKSSYQELAQDAHQALELLRKRADVDPKHLGYVARSEGGWVGPLAIKLGDAAFAAFVSGPSVSVADEDIDDYRVALREAGFQEGDQDAAFALLRERHAVIAGKLSADVLAADVAKARSAPWFSVLHWEEGEAGDAKVFRSNTITFDPASYLQTLGVPSLWLYGTDDKTIPAADSASRLMKLNIEPRPIIVVLPHADHALAVNDYPKLPGGVSKAAELLGTWIDRVGSVPEGNVPTKVSVSGQSLPGVGQ